MARILVVDDEEGIRHVLRQVLEYEGHTVRTASGGGEALGLYDDWKPDLTFLDVKMARMDGLEVLGRIRESDPEAVVVMISGHGSIDTAVEATRRGAYDFLEKPLDTDRILVTIRNALQQRGLASEVARLRDEVESSHEIVGRSFAIRTVLERIEKVGPTDARVLITGENGSGKELVARALHRVSPRSEAPFVEVNCAAIPAELIESELFGHVKGAFTGAQADRVGKFEQADGGTLFLDEIGDMSLSAQAKVLRALQEGLITRVGGEKAVRVDVRVIAATNKDLEKEIETGRFREDLFFRLNVVPINVPALRERREDIPMLVRHFTERAIEEQRLPPRRLSPEAVERLTRLEWPGNVRELKNTVERLLILSHGTEVGVREVERLSGSPQDGALPADLMEATTFAEFKDRTERAFILRKLRDSEWNVSETARSLDMPRSNLYKKIEKYGLVREETGG
ncbi:MAG TPA: sigma-54 dependent transcriptional regulator [Longimicrobiales bacterium]|nr:sigma-54 dependent transcriptional regulator [Longimicrobiales bacterium]